MKNIVSMLSNILWSKSKRKKYRQVRSDISAQIWNQLYANKESMIKGEARIKVEDTVVSPSQVKLNIMKQVKRNIRL
jgi:hypothetical protein